MGRSRSIWLESVNASAWLVYEAEEAGVRRLQAVQARQQGDAGRFMRRWTWRRGRPELRGLVLV